MTSTRPLRCTSGKDTWTGHGSRYASDTWTRTGACHLLKAHPHMSAAR